MTAATASWPLDWRTRLRVRSQSLFARFVARHADPAARRFHAFAVGLPRSGTHSLAAMFDARFRAAHEPALVDTLAHTMSWNRGERTPASMGAVLRWRDRRLGLELEAAHYLHHLTPLLVEEFPAARFVLTLRDPLGWIESEINQNVRSADYPFWRALEEQRYGRYGSGFPAPERDLAAAGCPYKIGSYLCYWRDHIEGVIQTVPADRLMVLRTDQIGERVPDLARFLDVDEGMIDRARSKSGVGGDRPIELRRHLTTDYLLGEVERHCSALAREWFPEQG